jgi:hypothetical protein
VVYAGIDEDPQTFVLSLRGAFQRARVSVIVRKLRGRNEVHAWTGETVYPPEHRARSSSRARGDAAPWARPTQGCCARIVQARRERACCTAHHQSCPWRDGCRPVVVVLACATVHRNER